MTTTGKWKSNTDPCYYLYLYKVDEKTCRVACNSIFGTVKHDGEKWQSEGEYRTTLVGVADPMLVNLVVSIDGIVRDGTGLVVSFGGTTNKFVRKAKPSAATKEDMKMLGWDFAGREEKCPCGTEPGYIACCTFL